MSSIGAMAMPADFRYKDVFLKGKPQHGRYDTFRIKHPQMNAGHRAKIFAPFDALDGYSDAVRSKDVEYVDRNDLTGTGLTNEDCNDFSFDSISFSSVISSFSFSELKYLLKC